MTTIESEKVTVASTADDVFTFLSDLNNLQELMPGERVTDWSSTEDTCQFQIKGLARIGMKVIERLPASTIRIGAEGKNPFDFTLTIR
ncbi:MAG: SRPBCC family protein, partial [Bacteroidota bacterium]